MTHSRKQAAHYFGLHAETIACLLLRLKGYRIIARRYRNYAGEVDIIAARFNMLVFVEVKARRNQAQLMETLQPKQQQRIIRAAELFLSQQQQRFSRHSVRFDMVLVCPGRWPLHLKDAWR